MKKERFNEHLKDKLLFTPMNPKHNYLISTGSKNAIPVEQEGRRHFVLTDK